MLVLILLFEALGLHDGAVYVIEQVLIYLAMVLTIISMIDYLVKNKGVIESC